MPQIVLPFAHPFKLETVSLLIIMKLRAGMIITLRAANSHFYAIGNSVNFAPRLAPHGISKG